MKIKFRYAGVIVCLIVVCYGIRIINDLRKRVLCSGSVYAIYTALKVYHADYGVLPEHDRWYDLLISETDFIPSSFRCPAMKKQAGKGNYILNKELNPSWREGSGDVVLVFEGDNGWNQVGGRQDMRFRHSKRCNVILSNGELKFITQDEVEKLKWVDEP